MIMSAFLISELKKVQAGNRENLLGVLMSFAKHDADFNGKNGLEYLWNEVWRANGYRHFKDYKNIVELGLDFDLKYESNADYVIDMVKSIENDEECVNTFFDIWMNNDCNYYSEYSVQCLIDNKDRVIAISFATMCGY